MYKNEIDNGYIQSTEIVKTKTQKGCKEKVILNKKFVAMDRYDSTEKIIVMKEPITPGSTVSVQGVEVDTTNRLSEAYSLENLEVIHSSSLTFPIETNTPLNFTEDGRFFFSPKRYGGYVDKIEKYACSVPGDITTGVLVSTSPRYSSHLDYFVVSKDGTTLYGSYYRSVYIYPLSTPYDTASYNPDLYESYNTGVSDIKPLGTVGDDDFLYLSYYRTIYKYSLLNGMPQALISAHSFSHSVNITTTTVSSDEKFIYYLEDRNMKIYAMTTPGDLSTVTLVSSYYYPSHVTEVYFHAATRIMTVRFNSTSQTTFKLTETQFLDVTDFNFTITPTSIGIEQDTNLKIDLTLDGDINNIISKLPESVVDKGPTIELIYPVTSNDFKDIKQS